MILFSAALAATVFTIVATNSAGNSPDATVALASQSGERTMPVEEFITGYRTTALAPNEVIAAIRIPFVPPGQTFAAYKLSTLTSRSEPGRLWGPQQVFGSSASPSRQLRALSGSNFTRPADTARGPGDQIGPHVVPLSSVAVRVSHRRSVP